MPGRISTAQIFEKAQTSVGNAREKEMISSEKAATGKEVVRPSQDPAGYMVSTALKDDLSTLQTTVKNANAAIKVLEMTETVFSNLQDTMQRAYELAISAAGGKNAGGDATRKYNLSEVETLYDSAIQLLNTRYGSRTLLAGFRSDKPAFDHAGNFLGDGGEIEIEVARGLLIPVNISAERAVLGVGINNGINLLGPLKSFLMGLKMGDDEMVRESLNGFERVNDQISLVRGEIGSRSVQIERAIQTQQQVELDGVSAISTIEDADAVKVFSDLARDQAILQAAISTSHQILNRNPTDIFYK